MTSSPLFAFSTKCLGTEGARIRSLEPRGRHRQVFKQDL
jgi:hypothetical protein